MKSDIDWDRLCNAPGIIFFQRWFIGVGTVVSAAALLATCTVFIDMRDATKDLTKASARIEASIGDHESRLRSLEGSRDTYRDTTRAPELKK
jgi:hypothetical protein